MPGLPPGKMTGLRVRISLRPTSLSSYFVAFLTAAHRFLCAAAILSRASALSLRRVRFLADLTLVKALFLPALPSTLERSLVTS